MALAAAPEKTGGVPSSSYWTGTADGGGTAGAGAVSLDFYGSSTAGEHPSVVLGEFKSHFSDGAAAGAFTAWPR